MIVARLSFLGFLGIQLFALGFTFLIWWLVLHDVPDRRGLLPSHDPLMWFFLALTPFFLLTAVVAARQFMFHDRRAVWVEDGMLFYFTQLRFRPVQRIPLKAIRSFSAGKVDYRQLVGYDGIRIEFEDGMLRGAFMTGLLSERREVVLARLNQALAESRH